MNRGLLPEDYYALPEQHAAGFGPDVRTLQGQQSGDEGQATEKLPIRQTAGVGLAAPRLQPTAETEMTFCRRKQKTVTVRQVSGDRIVAMVEIVSPGNKASKSALRGFVRKAAELLDREIHLLVIDLHPPGPRDPQGIHAAIWEEIAGVEYALPASKPMTLAAYESSLGVRAYVVHLAVGDTLAEMPLFLEPGQAVHVPLEATYQAAFVEVPRRWRSVLETAPAG